MIEVWRNIPGYESSHQVSNHGRVRTLDRVVLINKGTLRVKKGSVLRPFISTLGYQMIDLCKDSSQRKYSVHSLVAAAFIGERPRGYHIHHINHNCLDNRLDNLEYKSQTDHIAGENNAKAKLNKTKVLEIIGLLSDGAMTQDQIAKLYGVASTSICNINTGKTWAHITRPERVSLLGGK